MAKTLALALALCLASSLEGCKKESPGAPQASASGRSPPARSRARESATPMLTKEEVGAIIGEPVTEIDGTGGDVHYRTADMFMSATIDLEQGHDVDSAIQSMEGAHTATGALGGTAETVPGLGAEAFFGGMSTLHVRKGSAFFKVLPPNLQQQAQQGTEYEAKSRAMAVALATKLVEKL